MTTQYKTVIILGFSSLLNIYASFQKQQLALPKKIILYFNRSKSLIFFELPFAIACRIINWQNIKRYVKPIYFLRTI